MIEYKEIEKQRKVRPLAAQPKKETSTKLGVWMAVGLLVYIVLEKNSSALLALIGQ